MKKTAGKTAAASVSAAVSAESTSVRFSLGGKALALMAAFGAALLFPSVAMGQTISIDSISSPSMPSISSPTMGSGFYLPGNSSNPIYTGPNSQSQSQSSSSSSSESQSSTTSSSITSLASTITATDLSTMESLGLFDQISGLLGTDSSSLSSINLSNLYTSTSSTQTNLMLQEILKELESIKAENQSLNSQITAVATMQVNENTPVQTQSSSQTSSQASSQDSSSSQSSENQETTVKQANPRFLRFNVNGYNVLSTCRNIYISKIQADGGFLVTADRRYMSDGKTRTETFHILFMPNEASNGISSYSTATAVTQDYLNQYSFLYQLAQKGDLNATRTGNLVSLRTDDPNWKLELLIDLDE